MKQPAPTSFRPKNGLSNVILIIGVAVVGLIIIGVASGALKGSFNITKTEKEQPQTQPGDKNSTRSQQEQKSTPKPEIELTAAYINNKEGYSIKYPQGWKYQEDPNNTIFYPADTAGTVAGAPSVIVATVTPLGNLKDAQFATIVDSIRIGLKNEYSASEFDTDKSAKVGTYDGHLLGFTYEKATVPFQVNAYIVTDKGNMYNVITITKKDAISNFEDALNASTASFKIL